MQDKVPDVGNSPRHGSVKVYDLPLTDRNVNREELINPKLGQTRRDEVSAYSNLEERIQSAVRADLIRWDFGELEPKEGIVSDAVDKNHYLNSNYAPLRWKGNLGN